MSKLDFSIFSIFWGRNNVIIFTQILLPLSKYFNVTQRISNEKASELIGKHFKKEVDDQLLNAVLLFESDQNNELILASIEQKSKQLKGKNLYSH